MKSVTKVILTEQDLEILRHASEILREIDKATLKNTLGSYWLTCDIDMLANRSAYDDDDGEPYFMGSDFKNQSAKELRNVVCLGVKEGK